MTFSMSCFCRLASSALRRARGRPRAGETKRLRSRGGRSISIRARHTTSEFFHALLIAQRFFILHSTEAAAAAGATDFKVDLPEIIESKTCRYFRDLAKYRFLANSVRRRNMCSLLFIRGPLLLLLLLLLLQQVNISVPAVPNVKLPIDAV